MLAIDRRVGQFSSAIPQGSPLPRRSIITPPFTLLIGGWIPAFPSPQLKC